VRGKRRCLARATITTVKVGACSTSAGTPWWTSRSASRWVQPWEWGTIRRDRWGSSGCRRPIPGGRIRQSSCRWKRHSRFISQFSMCAEVLWQLWPKVYFLPEPDPSIGTVVIGPEGMFPAASTSSISAHPRASWRVGSCSYG